MPVVGLIVTLAVVDTGHQEFEVLVFFVRLKCFGLGLVVNTLKGWI